jgi:hypothetical protein
MKIRSNNSLFGKAVLATAALLGYFVFVGTPQVRADDECQRRIAVADRNLHEAIEHHGYQSKQAEHWREELHAARESCWTSNHRWWDEDGHRWHTERDWDDRDHDPDRDRDRK